VAWLVALPLLLLCLSSAQAAPAVALYYGDNPPWDELRAFDVVVVDPDHPGLDPRPHQHADSAVFAYASLGEVHPSKPYFSSIPAPWLIGENRGWGSRVIDQAQPGWPVFFVEKVLAPLWEQGYRGFFLDTLDSYQLAAGTPAERARQEAGMVAVVRAIKTRWPEARLIFNRGFEILPQVHDHVWMVAAESLFQGYDAGRSSYAEVKPADREWLLGQLQKVQREYRLPVLAIDYVPLERRDIARKTAAKIRDLGFIPWVATPGLDTLGVGAVEVLPRKVLLLYNPAESPDLHYADPQRFLAMPLAYLGFVIDYQPITEAPPAFAALGRYAGIVSWINSDTALGETAWPSWLAAQARAGVPLAVFSRFGVEADDPLFGLLGLVSPEVLPNTPLRISQKDSLMDFELPVRARSGDLFPLRLTGAGRPLLTLKTPDGQVFHPAALTPWGGYALSPYVVESLPGNDSGERWYLNPLTFLRAALRVEATVPVPDVTTENGRRLFFVHIDGDGFASQAELPGARLAGEVLRDDLLKRYPWPTTMSVIEGEVGPTGLYPQLSPRLEKVAKDIFALPHVEVASHTYSHPFYWNKAEDAAAAGDSKGYHLDIKGYTYDIRREISGSRDYINARLAPPGKKTEILLWSGNCVATPAALAEVEKAGLLNMNGGDTDITRSRNSWTRIAGLGVEKDGRYQVFAPNQNENVYTNLWTGPFYGFERVIETFELTDRPYRFKPVNLYFHVYAASKTASLTSLHRIYAWAGKQDLHPVYASDYIRKVLDFNHMTVARTADGYRIRGNGDLRNLHVPGMLRSVDWAASTGLAGMSAAPEGSYLGLADGSADIVLMPATPKAGTQRTTKQPYLASANARTQGFVRNGRDLAFGLQGRMPLEFALANSDSCTLSTKGREIKPWRAEAGLRHFRLEQHAEPAFELRCRP